MTTTAAARKASMERGRELLRACREAGASTFTGVPCSYLRSLFHLLEQQQECRYVPAPREDIAVAFAAGCYLGGGIAAVAMQNSGLGTTINPLTSLAIIYRIPVLMVIGWRGEIAENDAEEHEVMGPASPRVLEAIGVRTFILRGDVGEVVRSAIDAADRDSRPAAVLVPKGVLD
jgi:phosphonopyruvate decarboxylase